MTASTHVAPRHRQRRLARPWLTAAATAGVRAIRSGGWTRLRLTKRVFARADARHPDGGARASYERDQFVSYVLFECTTAEGGSCGELVPNLVGHLADDDRSRHGVILGWGRLGWGRPNAEGCCRRRPCQRPALWTTVYGFSTRERHPFVIKKSRDRRFGEQSGSRYPRTREISHRAIAGADHLPRGSPIDSTFSVWALR